MTDLIVISYGFTDIYGIKWHDSQVDLYNKVSEEIHDREIGGHYKASESMLDNRHRIYKLPFSFSHKMGADDRKSRRRSVPVDFENGNSLDTAINGTKESVRDYYLNNQFNLSPYGKEEPLTTGKTVIFLS